jgi:hypothetical protein
MPPDHEGLSFFASGLRVVQLIECGRVVFDDRGPLPGEDRHVFGQHRELVVLLLRAHLAIDVALLLDVGAATSPPCRARR